MDLISLSSESESYTGSSFPDRSEVIHLTIRIAYAMIPRSRNWEVLGKKKHTRSAGVKVFHVCLFLFSAYGGSTPGNTPFQRLAALTHVIGTYASRVLLKFQVQTLADT